MANQQGAPRSAAFDTGQVMRAEKTIADLSPREVIHIHCVCGRDRVLMPITLLSEG
jgi:hypothetical protein